jgi:hypothetical protein
MSKLKGSKLSVLSLWARMQDKRLAAGATSTARRHRHQMIGDGAYSGRVEQLRRVAVEPTTIPAAMRKLARARQ